MIKFIQINKQRNRLYWLILVFLGTVNISLLAQLPDETGARQFAESFFASELKRQKGDRIPPANQMLTRQYQSKKEVKNPVFVYQNGEKGFVVVGQNRDNFAVMGYSTLGQFDPDNIPPQLIALLKLYEDSVRITSPQTVLSATPVMTPLLDEAGVSLNQYNHENVGNCPTGCIATAFAQIMAYYKYPTRGSGSHCYTDPKHGQLCADFGNTTYNWNNPSDEDYKLLSYHVGIAIDMNYCKDLTGSSPAKFGYEKAIREYFNYYMSAGSSDSFYMMNEISNRRPVYAELPGDPGHAVVLDGYDTDGFFHINFGWGGHQNGYFALNTNSRFYVGYEFGTNVGDVLCMTPTPLKTNQQDSLALVAVHKGLGGTTGWDLTEPVFTWNGVLVMNERVIRLKLNSYSTYKGIIAPEIGNLTALQTLNLVGEFEGTLPADIFNLTELKDLTVSSMTGSIIVTLPESLGNLTNLETLKIPYRVAGSLPTSIGNLTQLSILNLNSANLSGSIPSEIGNLTRLTSFNLSKNKLTGVIPSDIQNLTNLTELILNENQLSGVIPTNIGNLTQLKSLGLSDNQLMGSIPESLGNCTDLVYLYLYNNQLSGSIPESLGNCTDLVYLYLYNNQLSGSIPASIGNLSLLTELNLSNNQLTSLPNEIGRLKAIKELKINNNLLTAIPDSIGHLLQLNLLKANHNNIRIVPANIGFLLELQDVNLSYNALSVFPDEFCLLPRIRTIGLTKNKITQFPSTIDLIAETIDFLSLDSNEIRGLIPKSILENGKISILNLANNYFTFEDIPVSEEFRNPVGNQRPVHLTKKIFKTAIGDTIQIDIRDIAPFSLSTNEYRWMSADKNKAVSTDSNPILTVIIDERTIKQKYYCTVTNPSSPNYELNTSGYTYTFPCLSAVQTDTLSFQPASEEELISEKYDGGYVVSTKNIPTKIIEDRLVTLVPPLRVRGTITWQASADGKIWYDLTSTMQQADLKANFVSVKQQELVLSPKTPAYYRCNVQDVNCEPLYSDTIKVNPFGKVLYDGTLNAATETRTVKTDSIEVTLPAGIYDKDFRLTIVKLDNPPGAPAGMKMSSAYDVTVSFGSVFETPILIRFNNLDKKKISNKNIRNFQPVYYDDKNQQWIPYESGGLSLRDSTIVFETNHLTKLSWWWDEETFLWGYTDYFPSGNIFVFYKESDVKHMQDYATKQTLQDWHTSDGTPWYIQDIAHFLSEVMTSFGKLGLPVPTSVFNVYVDSIADDGSVGISGMVNGYILINRKIDNPVKLRSLMAHEFMHYVQDSYIAANGGNLFWMEAHAHLSDRLVWDDTVIPVSESEHYLLDGRTHKDNIYKFLSNSWDYEDRNALGQKFYGKLTHCYQAGTFLHYMRSYREGENKLKPDVLLKETSYLGSWRSYLNSYIQSHLQSTIGDEYEAYLKYLLGGTNKNFTLLDLESNNPFSYIISYTRDKHFSEKIVYRFDKDNSTPQTDKINFSIPYLGSKVLMLYNSTSDRAMVVNCKRLHETDENNKIYYGRYDIKTKQTIYVDISDSTSYNIFIEARNEQSVKNIKNICFLLFLNKKNPSRTDIWTDFDVSMKLTATPVLNIENYLAIWIGGGSQGHTPACNYVEGDGGYKDVLILYGASEESNISYFDKYILNDSSYVVNFTYHKELLQDDGGYFNIYDRTGRIEYNFVVDKMSIYCTSNTEFYMITASETGETIKKISTKMSEISTLDLKDVMQNVTISEVGGNTWLQTPNVQELKNIIKNLSQDVTRTYYQYDSDGYLSKVNIKKSSFVDIDYTVPGVKLIMTLRTN